MAVQAGPAPLPRDSIYQIDASLTDQSGRRLTLASKRGRAQLVVMFYTSCKFICPTIIDTVLDLDGQLTPSDRMRMGVLMISLDPQRDDPTALKAVADQRSLDLTRWTLGQPRPTDVRAIAALLGVRYRTLADGELNHTGVLALLDTDGRVVARSTKTSGSVDPKFMDRIRAALTAPLSAPPAESSLIPTRIQVASVRGDRAQNHSRCLRPRFAGGRGVPPLPLATGWSESHRPAGPSPIGAGTMLTMRVKSAR